MRSDIGFFHNALAAAHLTVFSLILRNCELVNRKGKTCFFVFREVKTRGAAGVNGSETSQMKAWCKRGSVKRLGSGTEKRLTGCF